MFLEAQVALQSLIYDVKERLSDEEGQTFVEWLGVLIAPGDVAGALARIAQCESSGDPHAVGVGPAAGHYGKYHFDIPTWYSVGGTGNPADAPEAEQDHRAYLLYQQRGFQPWECASILAII